MTMLKCIYVSYLASCVGADKTTSPSLTCLLKSAKCGTAPPTPTRNTFSTAWQNKIVSNISQHQHRSQLKPWDNIRWILIRKYGGEKRSLLLFKIRNSCWECHHYLKGSKKSSCCAACCNQGIPCAASHGQFCADDQVITNLTEGVDVGLACVMIRKTFYFNT